MNQLPEFLRMLLYHLTRLGRQGGVTAATALTATGFKLFEPGTSMLDQLQHPFSLMTSIVGATVLFNFGLAHFNHFLEYLLKVGSDTEKEMKRTANLCGSFLGRSQNVDDEPPPAVKDHLNSKNATGTNSDSAK